MIGQNILSKLPDTGTSIFAIMTGLAREHNAINLSQGYPGFDCDPVLKELVHHYVKSGMNQYAPMPGVPALREVISNKINRLYQRRVDADREITITAGATQALYCAMSALIHSGDEVIIIDPAYDCYAPTIRLQGAVPISVRIEAPDFRIHWDRVEQAISEKTRMIILNNPHNPVGKIFNKADLTALRDIANRHDLLVLSDEVYEHIVFDDKPHLSTLLYDDLWDRTVSVYSFGKVFHNTGWKMGYAVAPKKLTDEIRKVHQFNVFSVNTPIQYALADYLDDPANYESVPGFFQEKRDFFIDHISGSKLKPLPCEGSYFLLCDYSDASDEDDMTFSRRVTIEQGVATIPLTPFYQNPPHDKVVRICFAKSKDELVDAAERIKNI